MQRFRVNDYTRRKEGTRQEPQNKEEDRGHGVYDPYLTKEANQTQRVVENFCCLPRFVCSPGTTQICQRWSLDY